MAHLTNPALLAQFAGVVINAATAIAMWRRDDAGFAVAFLAYAYAFACGGYAYSIVVKG